MKCDSMYHRARMLAADADPLFANRQRAADKLYVSCEALNDYERGMTVPPCDVVQRMIEVYGAHNLRGEHVKAFCPLMMEYAAENSELARAALGWAVALSSAQDMGREFASVALDGRITQNEEQQALTIRAKAVQLARLMQETIAAIDAALPSAKG